MIDTFLSAFSAIAIFEAFRLIVTSDDLLRLRAMTRLALTLAAAVLCVGPAPLFVAVLALTACRTRPDFDGHPVVSLLLLMTTPAVFVSAAVWLIEGWGGPYALSFGSGPTIGVLILVSIVLAIAAHPILGLGWRIRFVLITGSGFASIAGLWAACGGALHQFAVCAPALIGAAILSVRAGDLARIKRLAAGAALAIATPALIYAAKAGPWTQAEGEELLIVRAPLGAGGDGAYGVQSYSEAGASDDITVVVTGFQETSRRETRAGGMVGLRVALWREDDWIVGGEALAGIAPFSLNRGTSDWERHAQADLKLSGGWSGAWLGAPVYAAVDFGWRIRPEEFGDAFVPAFSAGIDLTPDLQANIHASAEINRGEDRVFGQASLLWRIDETVGLEAGVQSFTDRDGDTGAQAFAGLWLRF